MEETHEDFVDSIWKGGNEVKIMRWLVLGLILLTLSGCSGRVKGEEKTAQDHVEDSGYYVRERLGQVESYLLEEGSLDGRKENLVIERMWSVQEQDPRAYLGKEITVYGFVVKNHLLQQTFRSPKKIQVFVILCEGKVIGGYAYPDSDEKEAYYSFDGDFSTQILVNHYVFKGESETWTAEYVVDSRRTFTDKDGRIEYDGAGEAVLTVLCKGETEALGKVKEFEVAYSSRFGSGSFHMESDEAQYLDKIHTIRSSGTADQIGSVEETVALTVTVDGRVERMDLRLVD